jgi:hypothetical protein
MGLQSGPRYKHARQIYDFGSQSSIEIDAIDRHSTDSSVTSIKGSKFLTVFSFLTLDSASTFPWKAGFPRADQSLDLLLSPTLSFSSRQRGPRLSRREKPRR